MAGPIVWSWLRTTVFFWETFHGFFIYSFCQKSAEKKYFLYFILMSDLPLRLISHYILDYALQDYEIQALVAILDYKLIWKQYIETCNVLQLYTTYRITTKTIRFLFLSARKFFASPTCILFLSHDYSLFCSQPFYKR